MRFKNIHPAGDVHVPVLGGQLIKAGDITDVPVEIAAGFAAQPTNWEATDKDAKDLVKSLDEPTENDDTDKAAS